MKIPPRPPKKLMLLNIPIFSVVFFILYYAENYTEGIIQGYFVFACLLSAVLGFGHLPIKKLKWLNQTTVSEKKILKKSREDITQLVYHLLPILFLPFAILSFILTPTNTLSYLFPEYQPLAKDLLYKLPDLVVIMTFMTVSVAEIMRSYLYETAYTGNILSPFSQYFSASPKLLGGIEIFTGLGMLSVIIGSFGMMVLMSTVIMSKSFHIPLITGQTPALLLLSYGYILLPKIKGYERLLTHLSFRGWTIGQIYLLTSVIAIIVLSAINIFIALLPASLTHSLYHGTPITFKIFPTTAVWYLGILANLSVLSLLFGSALVRLQKNKYSPYNIPFALLLVFIVEALSHQHRHLIIAKLEYVWYGIFIITLFIAAFFIRGKEVALIGFLPNKHMLKSRVSIKSLIPSLQGIFILPILSCFIGIYASYLMVYITTLPLLVLSLIAIILSLVGKKSYDK
jgi:hypothetical protein